MPIFAGSPGGPPIQGPVVATQVQPQSPVRGPLARGIGALTRRLVDRTHGAELATRKKVADTLESVAGPGPFWDVPPFRIPRLWHPNLGTYYGGLSNYSTSAQWNDSVKLSPPAVPRRQRIMHANVGTVASSARVPAAMLPTQGL